MKKTIGDKMEEFVGSKHKNGFIPSDELERYISEDVNEAIKNGELPSIKFTIKKHRFSGGRSLTLTVRKIFQKPSIEPFDTEKLEAKLKEIGEAYNKTENDIMTDYYSTDYFFDVKFDLKE